MKKEVFELADTTTTETRGEADTTYRMQPRIWLKNIVDAAKKDHLAAQFAYQTVLSQGQYEIVIPKRRLYLYSGATNVQGSVAEGASVNYTALGNVSGVVVTPADKNYGVAISNKNIRTGAVDYVRDAREQLSHLAGDEVDKAVFDAIKTESGNVADASLKGAQKLYGGDATQSSEVGAGDVITTDMIAAANRKMKSTICQYWTLGTGESNSAESKNPWKNEGGSPFVCFVSPEQEETFLGDSQFVNASEYGSDKVIHAGEIGEYLRIKFVVSNNVPAYAAAATHADAQTTAVAMHRCMLTKAQKSYALGWGQKPKLIVFDYPSQLEKRLILEQAYQAKVLQEDSIVWIDVADQ